MVVAFGRVVEWCALRGCGDGVFCCDRRNGKEGLIRVYVDVLSSCIFRALL